MHKISNYTRCPYCWDRLGFSDWDDADVVIALHALREHKVALPAWWLEEK